MIKAICHRFVLLLIAISCVHETAAAAPVPSISPFQWPKLQRTDLGAGAERVRSGQLELLHSRQGWDRFVVKLSGSEFAVGHSDPMLGYLSGNTVRLVDLRTCGGRLNLGREGNTLRVSFECADPDGGHWQLERRFRPGTTDGAIEVQTRIKTDTEREVVFLPMFVIFPGAGSFGPRKHQGLLAGLEYLEDEPSSSEADVIGPAAKRAVPDSLKLTFPLMVIQNESRWLALTWQMTAQFSALFDSPDRIFGSGGHVMGVLFPGSDGKNREEGSVLPRVSALLESGQSIELKAVLLGGGGESVVPAVDQYIHLKGLPALPGAADLQNYVAQASGGWLDSQIRQSNQFRHAVAEGNFKPQPAADAAVWMDWLAVQTPDRALASRLKETARQSVERVTRAHLYDAGVGHVRFPVAPLIYGAVAENAERARVYARGLLARFEPDGSVRYHPRADGPDYGKTHYTNEATGLSAGAVKDLLEAAAFCGDSELLGSAIAHLRALDKFRNGVPRGAQTWECPLHTPDILAAAHMVGAYILGYELTGERAFLEQARYWAWTGVPFVYLVNPTEKPIGLYATIAVFGATQWRAPVWLGLPVQWCGLVYANALYRLAGEDPQGPWKKLADGITLSGIQQSWPAGDAKLQGLLPDSFVLRAQHRNGPAINPATVQACAVRYFSQPAVFDFHCFLHNGLRVYAPGQITRAEERARRVSFEVESWVNHPYYVLVNGLKRTPRLQLNGKPTACSHPHEFHEKEGWLILQLEDRARVKLDL